MSKIVFGIDLGTTNTVVSYYKDNKVKIVSDGAFKLIPSKIYISPENKIYCGNYIPIGALDIIHSFKVEIGKDYTISRNNKIYNINDILTIFINHIKNLINKKFTNLESYDTVITVPSNFSDNQREIIRHAFINNQFNVLRIINEPSAAALSYGLISNTKEESKIMVIDTGGGTMDITILQKDGTFFEVIHSIGLNDLGGNNFTNVIIEHIKKQYSDISDNSSLFYTAQRVKEKLSYQDSFSVNLKNITGVDSFYELSYHDFNKLSTKLLNRVDELITELTNEYTDIEYFILVGGSSKMKILQEKIYDITRKRPWAHPNLESVVSEGAAIYSAIISNIYQSEEDVLLVDVLPLSLGVETADGNFSIILPKNTPLPAKRSQKYTTDTPSENKITVKVYQGERKIANKNVLIGEFPFDKVSLGGMPVIDICFKVDLNGIINVIITDKKTGNDKSILIKDIPEYDSETLEKILKDAEMNNDADEEYVTKLQRIYVIKSKIENALINLSINDLISEESKKEIRDELNDIEEKIGDMNNVELFEVIQKLDDKYSGITTSNNNVNDLDESSKMDDMEKILINELKADIERRANMLMIQNPEWSEYIKPVIDQLQINNLTSEYLQEKLAIIKELQEDDTIERDYREELKNLCLYLKNQIDEGQLDLEKEKLFVLSSIIKDNLDLIQNNENDEKEIKNKYYINQKDQLSKLMSNIMNNLDTIINEIQHKNITIDNQELAVNGR